MPENPVPDSRDDGRAYGFSARDSERIATAVRRVESTYRNDPSERRRSPVTAGIGLIRVQLPSGIPAGSLDTPASTSDCIVLVRDGDGYTTEGAQTDQTIFNCDTSPVTGTNKSGWAIRREDNNLELVLADC